MKKISTLIVTLVFSSALFAQIVPNESWVDISCNGFNDGQIVTAPSGELVHTLIYGRMLRQQPR